MMAQSKQADFSPAVLFYDVTVRQDRFSLRDYILMHVLLAIGLGMLYESIAITVVCLLSSLFLLFFYRPNTHSMDALMLTSFIALGAVVLIYAGNFEMYRNGYYLGGSDDLYFENYARYAIECDMYTMADINARTAFESFDYKGFLMLLAWLMRFCDLFGGYHTICFRIINVHLWLAVALMISDYYRKHFPQNERTSRRIFLLTALFPHALYISGHVFRDTVGIFLIVFMYVNWDLFFRKTCSWPHRLWIALITLPALYIGYWVRKFNFFLILAIMAFSFLFMEVKNKKRHYLICLLLFLAALPIVMQQFYLPQMMSFFYTKYSSYLLTTNPGVSQFIFSEPLLPFGIFIRMAFGLIMPAPIWIFAPFLRSLSLNTVIESVVSIGTVVQLHGLPYILFSFRSMKKMSLTFLFTLLVVVSTTFTFRHFIMIYPFMITLFLHGAASQPYERRRSIFIAQSIFIAFLLIFYALRQ
ncbi:MAG: hypothetical protein ACOX36_00195 [Saccharofermentanales bacterium]|jgi:hypothetical protein